MDTLTKPSAKKSTRSSTLLRKARGFVELLGRSHFSFLQGASAPDEMVEQAIQLDYDGLAICDLNGLYGVARGYQATKAPSLFTASLHAKEGFRYLIGSEVTLTDGSHLTLMPMNIDGYQQLCTLLTLGKRQAEKGFSELSLENIAENSNDLLAFAFPPLSDEQYQKLESIFSNRLYLPVWKDLTWESIEWCEQAFHLEDRFAAQLFVTNRPFMHVPERKRLFDVLTCIHHHQTIYDAKALLSPNAEHYLRPLQDLSYLWQNRIDLVEKTLEIAARVDFSLEQIRYRYPEAQLPEGKNIQQYLRDLTEAGLFRRYGHNVPPKARDLLNYELKIISELNYEDYFLTLWEICQFADQKKILYQGRGSAANSVVCYTLGLTNIDPTEIEMVFERFISKERNEPPDIDIDFEHERREEVIQHIYEKYTEHHAAMVCTVICFRSKMAYREVAKVFGMPLEKINRIVKFMGRDGVKRLIDENVWKKFDVPKDTWYLILEMATALKGFPRHLGIHTGGFLITHDLVTKMVPVEKATMNGRYVIQWNKDDVNFLGLMKLDILSLGMLSALRKSLDLLREHKNLNYTLADLPKEDKKTYEMICRAETIGVFQIESRAQMGMLPRLKPVKFYDLVIEVAIVRPGPLQGGMVHPYLRRRQGLEDPKPPHKILEPILERTHGVPIFQEQVMLIAIKAANFTPGEADELRRLMSNAWRKKGTMDGVKAKLMKGLGENGINKNYAEQIYKNIEGFANYGFPESHAASFALLTYASCYLKRHHLDVFTCALLNSQPMGFYPPRVLIAEAQRQGVQIRPVDIQISGYDYTLEPDAGKHAIRIGLRSIYGIPRELVQKIEENRELNGRYLSLQDFIKRTELPKSMLLKLAASGAFSGFGLSARDLLWKIEAISLDRQSFLWGLPKENFSEAEDSETEIPFESNWSRLQREYQSSGFSVDLHPMSVLRSGLYRQFATSKHVKALRHKTRLIVAGLISITQRPPTAKGFCFITLEDEFGYMNIVIPPAVYQKDRMAIYSSSLLEIHGELEVIGTVRNLRAKHIRPLQINPES